MSYNPWPNTTPYYSSVPTQNPSQYIHFTSSAETSPYTSLPNLINPVSSSVPVPAGTASRTPTGANNGPATVEPPRKRPRTILDDGSRESYLRKVAQWSDEQAWNLPDKDILGMIVFTRYSILI